MKITRRQLRKIIKERAVGGLDKSVFPFPSQEQGLTFATWEELYTHLKKNNASIPYLCFIYYIGGLSGGRDFNFFEEYSDHKDIGAYRQALIELVSNAFANPATSFLSYDDELHATITGNTYSSGYDFVNVFLSLVQNYFGDNLTPEEQVMMTIGQAGAGGTQIERGSEYALKHPKHNNNNLVFKDAYDFTRFDFVARLGQDFLTSPHKVTETINPITFDNVYRIDGVTIPEPPTVGTAQSILNRMEDEYQSFPGGRIFEVKIKLNRRELRKLISEAITAGPEGVHRVPPEDRSPRVPVGKLTKDRYHGTAPKPSLMPPQVKDMLDLDDPEYAEQAYELSDTLQNLPSGTTKSGVSDFEYAKTMSKLANTPLDQIVRDNIPAEFYVYDVEYREEQDLDGHVDKEFVVYLHNNEGTREIEISHEPIEYQVYKDGRHVIIRVHELEPGKTWQNGRPIQQGMLDYKPVLFGLDYPDRFKKAMNMIVQRMK